MPRVDVPKSPVVSVGVTAQQVQAVKNLKPSIRQMERWMASGIAKATDGCKVEPDGCCPHGKPSWLIVMGII